jgi:hypothetical protein
VRRSSGGLIIRVRDYGAIDGDLIKSYNDTQLQDTVLANSLYLDSNFKEIKVNLQKRN